MQQETKSKREKFIHKVESKDEGGLWGTETKKMAYKHPWELTKDINTKLRDDKDLE